MGVVLFTSAGLFCAPGFFVRTIAFEGGRPESLDARWALDFTPLGPRDDGFGLDVVRLLKVDLF